MLDLLEEHYATIVDAFTEGLVVPFLGAGVNLSGRPQGKTWNRPNKEFLPSGTELAAYLSTKHTFPSDEIKDLMRVSQYITVRKGTGPLYNTLHHLFDTDYPPTPVHHFLAILPRLLKEKGFPTGLPLILTTNYDDLMERALAAEGVEHDIVIYQAEGDLHGKFVHWTCEGDQQVIEKPNEYRGLSPNKRPVILKIHGTVDRLSGKWESFVITEDHYIDYLTRADISSLVPMQLSAKLMNSHFLFLGYSLSDWNLRVILHRIWSEQKLSYKAWAIQRQTDPVEIAFWAKRDVDILDVDLEGYITELDSRVQNVKPMDE